MYLLLGGYGGFRPFFIQLSWSLISTRSPRISIAGFLASADDFNICTETKLLHCPSCAGPRTSTHFTIASELLRRQDGLLSDEVATPMTDVAGSETCENTRAKIGVIPSANSAGRPLPRDIDLRTNLRSVRLCYNVFSDTEYVRHSLQRERVCVYGERKCKVCRHPVGAARYTCLLAIFRVIVSGGLALENQIQRSL